MPCGSGKTAFHAVDVMRIDNEHRGTVVFHQNMFQGKFRQRKRRRGAGSYQFRQIGHKFPAQGRIVRNRPEPVFQSSYGIRDFHGKHHGFGSVFRPARIFRTGDAAAVQQLRRIINILCFGRKERYQMLFDAVRRKMFHQIASLTGILHLENAGGIIRFDREFFFHFAEDAKPRNQTRLIVDTPVPVVDCDVVLFHRMLRKPAAPEKSLLMPCFLFRFSLGNGMKTWFLVDILHQNPRGFRIE